MAKPRTNSGKPSNGANLGFEQKLWAAADKLRGHMDASEYKHVVLGSNLVRRKGGPKGRVAAAEVEEPDES